MNFSDAKVSGFIPEMAPISVHSASAERMIESLET